MLAPPAGGSRTSFYQHHVLPHLLHLVMQQEAMHLRAMEQAVLESSGQTFEVTRGINRSN
jgi:hypothetical protein